MGTLTNLEQDFVRLVALCASLENTTLPERVTLRLSRAFSRGIEKAFCVGWLKDGDQVDPAQSNPSVLRAAERGARDYLP